MTQIDGKINLVMLLNIDNRFLVLHVDCYELVADFGGVLGVVNQTKLLISNIILKFWVVFKFDAFGFDFFAPAVLIQAFPEEDNVSQHDFVVASVDAVAHSIQIKSKYLIYKHFLAIIIIQKIVVSLPF